MKNSLTFASKIALIALLATACKKNSVEPIENNTAQASLSGIVGWKGQKPTSNQRVVPKETPWNQKRSELANKDIYPTMNNSIISGNAFNRPNNQTIYLDRLPTGNYNIVRLNRNDGSYETMKGWSADKVLELGSNEKWPVDVRDKVLRADYQ